jgi:aconitase A
MNIDLATEPLGQDPAGAAVYLRDIWPTNEEVQSTVQGSINQGMFRREYAQAFAGDENWRTMPARRAAHSSGTRSPVILNGRGISSKWWIQRRRFRIWRECACWRCRAIR